MGTVNRHGMQEPTVPTVLAMLLCDTIITDAKSQKKTLVGIFDWFTFPKLPAGLGGFSVYARLTDAEGLYIFKLRFVRLEDDKLLAEAFTDELEAKDRFGFVDLALAVPILAFERAGRYEFQLYANDVYVGRTTVTVRVKEPKE